jgi:hypothetical protein
MRYYNGARTHLSLNKDAPLPRAVQAAGRILPTPILGGLHHHYITMFGFDFRQGQVCGGATKSRRHIWLG